MKCGFKNRRILYTLVATAGIFCVTVSLCLLTLPSHEERASQVVAGLHARAVPVSLVPNGQKREILNVGGAGDVDSDLVGDRQNLDRGEEGNIKPQETEHETEDHWKERKNSSTTKCEGPWPGYLKCQDKINWMALNWKIDPCYAKNGVDGSNCSFQRYLAEVERWCPHPYHSSHKKKYEKAAVQYQLAPLLARMSGNSKFDWIGRRISTHWDRWTTALRTLEDQAPFKHSKQSILIHIGALTDKAGFKFAENADHGGPLGELVQWSDLIASLYLLGHTLDFSTEFTQLRSFLDIKKKKSIGGCPTNSETRYSAIYIDIVGLKQFRKMVKNRIQHYQCLFRVLDSFGTEPQFNYKPWKPPHRRKGDYGQAWGNWNLNPRQFFTMYPHTPDNSFLGFVVGSNRNMTTPPAKKNIGLVYGKELYMWQGKRNYIDLVSRYIDVHATIGTTRQKKNTVDSSVVPGHVLNHGILDSTSLQKLLSESKVFIGMGFPYEGPAPLEAIANGCFFINPKLSPPLNRYNSKFLKGKPTLRSLTSQNPYAERFIGEPYVFTINKDDNQDVIRAMEKISHLSNPPGYLPYEFTNEGMLERITVYLENQDFCSPHQWPTKDSLITTISKDDESCKDACYREGMVCEPELFRFLNSKEALNKFFECSTIKHENSLHGPSHNFNTHHCSMQSEKLLYTCVGSEPNTQRLCPCRTYRKGQVALCSTCTR